MARRTTFWRDERGAAAVVTGILIMVLIAMAAIAVDVGSFFFQKRRQQTANDLAALAAAADIARAEAAATATVRANRAANAAVSGLDLGVYTPDPFVARNLRFQQAAREQANAARVTLTSQAPMFFSRIFSVVAPASAGDASDLRAGRMTIRTSAAAAIDNSAAFVVGSRLLALENGILNSVLGSMLGGDISLSVMDYNALASTRIGLFGMSDKLARRLNLSTLTYDDLLTRRVRPADVIGAVAAANEEHSTQSDAARAGLIRISQALAGSQATISLDRIFNTGAYGARSIGDAPQLAATASMLDLLSAVAQAANGQRQIEAAIGVNLPGLSSVRLRLGVGERPVGATGFGVGAPGASAHTAQTRLLLTVNLLGSGNLSIVRVPLYLELASATARLTQISCPVGSSADATATLKLRPAVIDAWIGNVSEVDFYDYRRAPNPTAATLVNLPLVSITGRARATISNINETTFTFTSAEARAGVTKKTSTQDYTASLLAALISDLDVRAKVLGIGLGLGADGLEKSALQLVAAATPSIDALLDAVLNVLGVSLGQAEVGVTDIRCGSAVLVN